jgi:hypothetical protein
MGDDLLDGCGFTPGVFVWVEDDVVNLRGKGIGNERDSN